MAEPDQGSGAVRRSAIGDGADGSQDWQPGGPSYLRRARADLLRCARKARHPLGFGWLADDGSLSSRSSLELWITCRMTHVFGLAQIVGEGSAGSEHAGKSAVLGEHGVESLLGSFLDGEHGGWFSTIDANGPVGEHKTAYDHAFVLLAASTASAAGFHRSDELIDRAMATSQSRFWDDNDGMVVDEWDRSWSELSPYRGINANMHTVEAYLAVADLTGESLWRDRALAIASRVVALAEHHEYRIPEHFDSAWRPLLDYNRDRPMDPFRPFGATIGHAFEWARLLAATVDEPVRWPVDERDRLRMLAVAVELTTRATSDGWASDGQDGFVYTTDWEGRPVARHRMHWVAAEAINTAHLLDRLGAGEGFAELCRTWWAYVDQRVIDHRDGSWRHELDENNQERSQTWHGRPDIYHAYQTALIPVLPLAGSLARSAQLLTAAGRSSEAPAVN